MAKKRKHHIMPQVYLRDFGFRKPEFNNKWFISVKKRDRNGWHDREIKGFLYEKNYYGLGEATGLPQELLENDLHGKIESRIRKIIEDLEKNKGISFSCKFAIAETVANLMCRGKPAMRWLLYIIEKKEDELIEFITHENYIFESNEEVKSLRKKVKDLSSLVEKQKFLLAQIMQRIKITLLRMDLTVFKCYNDFLLFTSDNPVSINGAGYGELSKKQAEVYCALNKKYLIYFYWDKKSCEVESIKDSLIANTIQPINQEFIEHFCKGILPKNSDQFIISPIRIKNSD